ncbi:MAG TPA: serine hydrolase domain-containing protein [Pseudonocardiaceae bacterium]|nr:serine hydrolase domain-containing protein [Pseudonocardiaceae bacterium]
MLDTTKRALDHRIATEQHDRRAPSLVAAVVREGSVLWSGARGRVAGSRPTTDTQYRIGSITKTFVTVLIMRLRDEGRLSLSDPLSTYVPGTSFGDRTIADLLAHTSGITAEPAGSWWERSDGRAWADIAASGGPETVRTRAGRRHHYSNLGFAALGEVVARLRGHSWLAALQEEVLSPLEMSRTTAMPVAPHASGWAVHPWADVVLPEPAHDARGMGPAGQLWSTVADLGRWADFLGGDVGEVLAESSLEEMATPLAADDATESYGLGMQMLRDRGRLLVGHTGSMPGFVATVWVNREERLGAVAVANSTAGVRIAGVVADLVDVVATREPYTPAEWVPMAEVDQELLALTGPWYWGPQGFALKLKADRWLELVPLGGDSRYRFRPETDGTWTGLDGYYAEETLRAVRDENNEVTHLNLNTFILTRTPYDPTAPIPGGITPWQPLS